MRTSLSFVILCIAVSLLTAQAPNKMTYQAVVRNAAGDLVKNTSVGMRTTIHKGADNGPEVYKEIYNPNPSTNANGLVTVQVGGGIAINGSMAAIDWSAGPYFIRTETDPSGGTNYTVSGASQLLSVPYALYAEKAASGTPGPQGPQGPAGPVGPQGPKGDSGSVFNGTTPGQMLYWNGSAWVTVNPGGTGLIMTICDGVPTWGPCPTKVPVVTTKDATCRNGQSFTAGGEVLLDGGAAVTERGLCWSLNANPTIADNKTTDGTGAGKYTSIPSGLQPNTKYYFRAYATNSNGTGYGNEFSLTTPTDTTPVIGCYYQGGILYYILREGDPGYSKDMVHGLIVMPSQKFSELYSFGCLDFLYTWGLGFKIGEGKSNTKFIVENCPDQFSAAKICYDYEINGYDDWFLPSRDEMIKLYLYRVNNGLNHEWSFTSTKNQNDGSIIVIRDTGGLLGYNPNQAGTLTAIRSF
jgi:hypothetical protein